MIIAMVALRLLQEFEKKGVLGLMRCAGAVDHREKVNGMGNEMKSA
jgi:hypothetical protein